MGAAAAAAAGWPAGNLPPLFTHSSIVANAVNFLVLANDGLDLSWQIPLSDFFTAGSAALSAGLSAAITDEMQNILTNVETKMRKNEDFMC
jgi:hypothetical protein